MYELKYTEFGTARREENGYWMIISKGEYYGNYYHSLKSGKGGEVK